MTTTEIAPITRNPNIDALQEAVRWPKAEPRTALALAGLLQATRRYQEGHATFRELAADRPDQPLFLALAALFQARLAAQQPLDRGPAALEEAIADLDRAVANEPGLTTYFRGAALAELPAAAGHAEAAVADLEWVLASPERVPSGFRRGAYRYLARAFASLGREDEARAALRRSGSPSPDPDQPTLVTDYWMTADDGFHFVAPRLVEPAPGIYVAQGYDFADFAFVETDDGIVAIDAGTTEEHVRAALADLRRRTASPIRYVIVTHAHWDHIGGLGALKEPGVRVIARASYAEELRLVNETGGSRSAFFGRRAKRHFELAPDHLVSERETQTVGGTELVLYPVSGETDDALLVHLPARGVVFAGDVLTPYVGAPSLPEGSPDGLFETMGLIRFLAPRLLIHGHTAWTENLTVEALPGLEAALRELYLQTLHGIREGTTVVEILRRGQLPDALREHPSVVLPFLLMRENFVKRVYHRRSGYWKPDGEGIEQFAPHEWAAALDLLGGGEARAFVDAATMLLDRGDDALALQLIDLGLLAHPASGALAGLRRRALNRLREQYQQLNPFKFVVYSARAGAELLPVG